MERQEQNIEFLALHAFKTTGFTIINNILIEKLGGINALIFCNYINKYNYFKEHFPKNEGWFFITHKNQSIELQLSEYSIKKTKKELKKLNLIETKLKGTPPKEWYKINFNNLLQILNPEDKKEASFKKTKKLNPPNSNCLNSVGLNPTNSTKYNKIKDNKIIVSKDTIYIPTEYLLCIDKIIEHWNKFPNCTKHKKGTKLYETLKKQFFNLLSGKPLLNTKENNPTKPLQDFFKKYNIPQNLYTKKWTEKEIIKLLRKISKSESDKKLSLPNIMWNQFAQRNNGFSLFLFEASKSNISWQYISLAIQLSNIVKPDLCKSKQLEWAKEFQFLIEQDKKDIKEVTELLQWYASNKDDIYTPIADDAMEFCEKYEKIKRAKERKLKKNLYNKPKNGSRYFDDVNKEYTDYDKNTFIEKNGKLIKIK